MLDRMCMSVVSWTPERLEVYAGINGDTSQMFGSLKMQIKSMSAQVQRFQ